MYFIKHKIHRAWKQQGNMGLKQSLDNDKKMIKKTEIQGPFSIDCGKRGSHAQGVYCVHPHSIPRAWEQQG